MSSIESTFLPKMHTGYIKYVSIIPWAGYRTLLPVHFLKQKHIFQPFFSPHCNPTCFQHFLSFIRYTVISGGHIFQPFHPSTQHTVVPAKSNIQPSHIFTEHTVKITHFFSHSSHPIFQLYCGPSSHSCGKLQ